MIVKEPRYAMIVKEPTSVILLEVVDKLVGLIRVFVLRGNTIPPIEQHFPRFRFWENGIPSSWDESFKYTNSLTRIF